LRTEPIEILSRRIFRAFSDAVALHDGQRLARLFTEQGTYTDCFYGTATGREQIARLIDREFFGTADDFRWTFHDPVGSSELLYARYAFSYRSKVATAPASRVGFEGVAIVSLHGEQIASYREIANTGPMLASLGYASDHLRKILLRENQRVWSQPQFRSHTDAGE
jgi:hypothetical protein